MGPPRNIGMSFVYLSVYSRGALEERTLLKKIAVNVANGFYLMLNPLSRKTKIVTSAQSRDRELSDFFFVSRVKVGPDRTFEVEGSMVGGPAPQQLLSTTFVIVNKPLPLHHGDILLLGKQPYLVSIEGSTEPSTEGEHYNSMSMSMNGTCRICLQSSPQCELITPCSCRGSCATVHYRCLTTWISTCLLRRASKHVSSYSLKHPLSCQICKTPFPQTITINNQDRPLNIPLSRQTLTLRQINADTLHCIHMPEDGEITIGRNTLNDLMLEYASVSRHHCTISRHKGQYYVRDKGSKYGTFLSLNRKIEHCTTATLLTKHIVYVLQSAQSK